MTEVRLGNVGLSSMRGPGVVNMNLSFFRNFKITERINSGFRVEAFDISNTMHLGDPNRSLTSFNFGKITSAANDPRSFRFGLRLTF